MKVHSQRMPAPDEITNLNLDLHANDTRMIVFYCVAGEPWAEYLNINDSSYEMDPKYQDTFYIRPNSIYPIWKTCVDKAFVMYCNGELTDIIFGDLYYNAIHLYHKHPEIIPYG